MGQVPASEAAHNRIRILVIGDGRVATTLQSVFQQQAAAIKSSSASTTPIELATWSRRSAQTSLADFLQIFPATHVWLAISDRAIETLTREHAALLSGRTVVHFAGSLPSLTITTAKTSLQIHAAHPLTTFAAGTPMSGEAFATIPFILDLEGPALSELLPGATNPAYRLAPTDRAYYHALCTIAGNFSVLLWETVADRFDSKLGLSANALETFRARVFANLAGPGPAARSKPRVSVLTGPLVRDDLATIDSHHRALMARSEIPLLKIYDAFTDLYRTERSIQKRRQEAP